MERSSVFVVVFMCFLGCFEVGFCESETVLFEKSFISWDDMKVDEDKARLNSRFDFNRSKIIVVDMNGEGDSLTVQGGIDLVPENNTQRVKIYILPGIYREKVFVPRSKPYVSFIGKESKCADTVITWNNKASDIDSSGVELGTYRSASVTIESDYFCATGVTFENTVVAEPGEFGMQAVALRVSADKSFFHKVRILGTQDTLLDETGSHFFYKCHIQGAVDFIFGRGRSLFQDCVLQSTAKRSGAIAAHHRDTPFDDSGFSFVGCIINGTGKILLGRAWGNYSRAIYSYCFIDDIITPPGWSDWNNPDRQKTVFFGEYECSGRGAETGGRVPWSKTFSYEEVRPFLDMQFIKGDEWLRL
ncbi:pectinesterase QRT1 [Mercurialis annua]|uniref:pectinesterase QRT1 n=1 Tax=Mercurialis annua TaxID=3986 RepID=UPI002160A1C7|nr:pectinesterase QRT1 [Mercurialis annua]